MIDAIENLLYIKILPITKFHIETVSELKVSQNHNDPFDHAVIAHAITEILNMVSSDRKFKNTLHKA
ncbi:MAG: PIN domain-containing protein [Psychroflexus sp.]|uniref:Type II toxin-antitoxin system VapC family toxin n=1 Tax=Mesohalobacter halotolerans TaxID=1883405 RepID=A0A4U5TPD9_9FLAO|nr:PIN domain-containing protein [Psychroflexus sp.]TKS55551.1 type II toxin-antitoxin system VapC family toxin [Mesohalobacter halotolerans]